MAWIRGERPWDQFLNYCKTVAQIDGSQLRSAQLRDERFDEEIEKILAQPAPRSPRPPLEGDTAEIRAIRDLDNTVRLLIRLQTGADVKFRPAPETAADRLEAKRKSIVRAHLSQLLS